MKKAITLVLSLSFLVIVAHAQPWPGCIPVGPALPGVTSPGCIMCSDVLIHDNIGYPPGMSFNCGVPHNSTHQSIYADGTGTLDATFLANNCQTGDGLQLIVFDFLTGAEFACFSSQGAITGNVFVGGLVPGDLYLLMVDGFNADECEYTLIVNGGATLSPPDPPGPITASPQSPYCQGTEVIYSISPVNGATEYLWEVPSIATIIDGGGFDETFVEVVYTAPGGGAIKVTPSNSCFVGVPAITPGIAFPSIMVTWPDVTICENELPWDTMVCGQTYQATAPGFQEIICTQSNGCDSIIQFDLFLNPEAPLQLDTIICEGDCVWIDGTCFDSPGFYTIPVSTPSQVSGCDSTVYLNLGVIEIDPDFGVNDDLICIGELITVTFFGSASSSAIFNWGFDGGTVISGSGEGPYVINYTSPGIYDIELFIEDEGCISPVETETVTVDPELLPLDLTCVASMDSVLFSWTFDPIVTNYIFNVLTGQVGTQIGNSNYLFTGLGFDEEVTLEVLAVGNLECPDVLEVATCTSASCPPISSNFMLQNEACLSDTLEVIYSGNASSGANYNWNFGSATVISGTGSGPYFLNYSTSGSYDISLEIEENGCFSSITTKSINVLPDLNPLNLSCSNDFTKVVFSWIPDSNVSSYNFTVLTGQSGMQNGDTYIVSNLSPGENVTLQVTANSQFNCPAIMETMSCAAKTCPVYTTTFSSPTQLCQTDSATITYTGNAPDSLSFNWNFGNATVVSGSDSGPYVLSFSSGGNYPLSLQIEESVCVSGPTTNSINVGTTLLPLSLTCISTINNITFNWAADANVSNYQVNVLTGQAGTMTGATSYQITGLQPNETVTLEVIATTNNGCAQVSDQQTCTAQDCPSVTLNIEPVSDICLSANTQSIQLVGTAGNGTGTFAWSGTGVSSSGLFSPTSAGAGMHTITLVYSEGLCQYQESTIINVFDIPDPSFTVTSPICETDVSTITYTGSASAAANFNWNFGAGTVLSGTGVGPFEVSYPTGSQTVSLIVSENGCASIENSQPVQVDPVLPPPIIRCGNLTTSSVEFIWDPVPGAVSYSINGPVGTSVDLANRTALVPGLNPGDEVTIEVIAEGNGGCPPSRSQLTCMASNCPPVSINLSPQPDVCLAANSPDIQLPIISTPDVLNFKWNPPVDAIGVLNPNDLGVGVHNLSYTFTDMDGFCQFSGTQMITIYAEPTADFSIAGQTCEGELVTVNYSGNASSSATFNWNFGNANILSGAMNGPYELEYPNAGQAEISLTVSENGCTSTTNTERVQIDGKIAAPIINCQPTINQIEFSWADVPGAVSYNVEVLTGQVGTQNGNNFTVPNLMINEEVVIRVTASSGNACPPSQTELSCTTINCPIRTLGIEPVTTTFCEGDSSEIQLAANIDGAMLGNFIWTGQGITSDGKFSTAGLTSGVYPVQVVYEEMGCNYQFTTSITVEPSPEVTVDINSPIWFINQVGSVTTSVQNGLPPYNYLWSNGNTSTSLDSVLTGEYCVTITDQNGCEKVDCPTILKGQYSTAPIHVICPGESAFMEIMPQVGATFQWAPFFNLNCTNCPAPFASPRRSERYTVTATLPNGQSESTQVFVVVLPPLLCNLIGMEEDIDWTKEFGNIDMDETNVEVLEEKVIEVLKGKHSIEIYPNPTSGVVTIQSNSALQSVEVFDTSGKIILRENSMQVDLSNQREGVYLFKIQTKEKTEVKRVVLIQ